MFSYISHLYCAKCSLTYDHETIQHTCICGSPLLVQYDYSSLKKNWNQKALTLRNANLWRYHELLPVQSKDNIVSLGEGITPLIRMNKIGERLDIQQFFMKDEGMIPTGTFKARGAVVGISKAKELGVDHIIMPTNGNAGAAWSQYAARAGIQSTILMPTEAPTITQQECIVAGANLYLVDGLINDAGNIVKQAIRKDPSLYDVSTLKEPYRIEGKKTMGLEIAEQFNWEVPDVIIYPTGGGVGLIGIYKGLMELKKLGWLEGEKLPRLVAVQAEGCAPIVKAWEEGKVESKFWNNAKTLAFGINVPKALGDFLVLDAIYHTKGCAVAVSDKEIIEELQTIAQLEGAFICPEGAAAFSAARKLRQGKWIKKDETVVVLNTGAGIKYPNILEADTQTLQPGDSLM